MVHRDSLGGGLIPAFAALTLSCKLGHSAGVSVGI